MARHAKREPGETGAFWPGVGRWMFRPARDDEGRPHIRFFWVIAMALMLLFIAVKVVTGGGRGDWNGPPGVFVAGIGAFGLIAMDTCIASIRARRETRTSDDIPTDEVS